LEASEEILFSLALFNRIGILIALVSNFFMVATEFSGLFGSDALLSEPIVQELSRAAGVDLPLIIPNKVLMDEGTWNGHFFSADAIRAAFEATDWTNRDNLSIYYEHKDKDAGQWLGEIRNPRLDAQGRIIGDLAIADMNFALKYKTMQPKFGMSPSIHGKRLKGTNNVLNFTFDNFSVVKNPAIKTAYLNSVGLDSFESGNINLYKTVDVLTDGSEVDVKKFANGKGGIKMAEEEVKEQGAAPEATQPVEGKEEVKEAAPVETKTEEVKAEEAAPTEGEKKAEAPVAEELAQKQAKIEALQSVLSEMKGEVAAKTAEVKAAEVTAKLSSIEAKLESLGQMSMIKPEDRKDLIPNRLSVNAPSGGAVSDLKARYEACKEDPDGAFMKFLQKTAEGGYSA
jgi:hypothetical protein